jgi:hypothetical protein
MGLRPEVFETSASASSAIPASGCRPVSVAHPSRDRRQERQEDRIDQGIRSGELNRRETARLERGQAHVNRMENRPLADGHINRAEFRRIEAAQNTQSHRIYHQKHDRQHRRGR